MPFQSGPDKKKQYPAWPHGGRRAGSARARRRRGSLTSTCASRPQTELPCAGLCVVPAGLCSLVPPRPQEKSAPPAAALGGGGRRGRRADNPERGPWPPSLHPCRSQWLTLELGRLDRSWGFLTSGVHRCAAGAAPPFG